MGSIQTQETPENTTNTPAQNTPPELIIRYPTFNEHATIADYQIKMALETESLQLEPYTVNCGVTNFIESGNYYLVCEHKSQVTGCLGVTVQYEVNTNELIGWLESVYVERRNRKRGFFKAMLRHNFGVAREKGFSKLRLYVEDHNEIALKTYRNQGFYGL